MRKNSALEIAIIVGLVWAGVQFLISEGSYRLGMMIEDHGAVFDPSFLYDISNMAAWPAGDIYDSAEREVIAVELRSLKEDTVTVPSMEAEGKEVSVNVNELADQVLAEDTDDYEKFDLAQQVLIDRNVLAEVTTTTEYAIYGGVCVAWGFAVGLITFFVLYFSQREERYDTRRLQDYR